MTFKPGKLYQINRHFWYLFPTKRTAVAREAAAAAAALADAAAAASWASYWSKHLNCNVSFISEGDTFMVVDVSGTQVKVISQEGKSGWINFPGTEEWVKKTINKVPDDT